MARRRRRNPERERFWQEAIAGHRQSGQSVRSYCNTHRLSEPSFYSWRRALAERDAKPTPILHEPTFVPLRVVADTVLEVVLPTGLVVRAPAGANPVAIAKLVAALVAPSC